MSLGKLNFISKEKAREIQRTINDVSNIVSLKNKKGRRRVRTGSRQQDVGPRPYVRVTSEIELGSYLGNVLAGPEDDTIIESGVSIKVKGLVANGLEAGDEGFSDKVENTYYIQSLLLI